MIRNTLGVALYRSGQYARAKAVLEASLARGKGQQDLPGTSSRLAMCHHHLGNPKAAREHYDHAVAWVKSHGASQAGDVRQLAELQAEARRLLGLRN